MLFFDTVSLGTANSNAVSGIDSQCLCIPQKLSNPLMKVALGRTRVVVSCFIACKFSRFSFCWLSIWYSVCLILIAESTSDNLDSMRIRSCNKVLCSANKLNISRKSVDYLQMIAAQHLA